MLLTFNSHNLISNICTLIEKLLISNISFEKQLHGLRLGFEKVHLQLLQVGFEKIHLQLLQGGI